MSLPYRRPLPSQPIATLINGNDTTAQAKENQRRTAAYLDLLRSRGLELPVAPGQSSGLGIARISEEAGLSLGVLRQGKPLRQQIERAITELGLATIVEARMDRDTMRLKECQTLFTAMAPAKASELGIKAEAMQGFVGQVFDLLKSRAKGNHNTAVLPIVRELQRDAEDDVLDISPHVRRILLEFDGWLALRDDPGRMLDEEALASMAFSDLMLFGMDRAGLSQGRAADICGIPQSTLWKWLHQGRAPNVRNHAKLRVLARHFGFPEEALINAIVRLTSRDNTGLKGDDFPEEYRGRRFQDLRNSVKRHVTENDLCLSTQALRLRIAELCARNMEERRSALQRKEMRDTNRIDRSQFPAALCEELDRYGDYLEDNKRKSATRSAYRKHLEGFFNFAWSGHCPPNLRIPASEASLVSVASSPLWNAYFRHLETVGREKMGAEFLISRTIVERMKSVEALFNLEEGFMQAHADFSVRLAQLGGHHLPGIPTGGGEMFLLRTIQAELNKLRRTWMKKSKKPTLGRDQIADLLALPDPLIAVRQIVRDLRDQQAKIEKWARTDDTDAVPRLNHHYATNLRKLVLIHLLGQTALRIGMVPDLTVGRHAAAHLQWHPNEPPTLTIPATLFKNETSEVFKDGPYRRVLVDIDGFFEDLREYLKLARPFFLDGSQDDRLFLTRKPGTGCGPAQANVLGPEITDITKRAVGIDAPPGKRLIRAPHLRPHHFRDILATHVLHATDRDYALAGDAIHVTEGTARAYYARDSVDQRRPRLESVLNKLAEGSHASENPRGPNGPGSAFAAE